MALPKACSVTEQNVNTISGVQVDTAVYVGTGAAGVPFIRVGRDAPVYVLEGVQTAVVVNIVAETVNAKAGDRITIRRGTGAASTSILQVVNATTGGVVVTTSSGSNQLEVAVTFNGVVWK